MEDNSKIIVFPEYEKTKTEVEGLRTELSVLLLEKDELRLVICKNIETAYMLALGSYEYKAYEWHCEVLRIKRKIDIIQAKKNRQEKVILAVIDEQLDKEFAEYQQQLNERIEKMNKALEHNKGKLLTAEETKELKKLYHSIVKALHPDLHPDTTPTQIQLFHNAVQAYEHGDLDTLCIISEMVAKDIPEQNENGLTILLKEKERLTKSLKIIRNQISEIKSNYPYINSIDEYATEITSAISAISTTLNLFASDDEIKENASFIFYLNESVNRFNKYVPLYRKYDKIREPLENKVDIA